MEFYFDNASTTKPLNDIYKKIKPYFDDKWYNPSSLYAKGSDVRNDIESIRKNVAKSINAKSEEIFFTSGSCESNNWIIRGFDDANINKNSVIITTPIEHKSILNAVGNPALHSKVCFCSVNTEGFVDIDSLKELLKDHKGKDILVSIIFGNNEIGTIQNIKKISSLVHSFNGILHTDATQVLGHLPINVTELGIDAMSASAQKLGGLKGTGFLYKSNEININPLIYGEQENKQRGGTENVIGIVALGEAIKQIDYRKADKVSAIRNVFIQRLKYEGYRVNGSLKNRLPNNISITIPQQITGESLIYMMETSGIYISSGSACNSQSQSVSHVLKAIGLTDEDALKTIRITIDETVTVEKIEFFINELKKQIKLLTV